MTDEPSKACTKCGQVKLLSEFYVSGKKRASACKLCKLRSMKLYRDKPEIRASRLKLVKAWRERNPKRSAAIARAYAQRNLEKVHRATSSWKIKNPEKIKEAGRKYGRRTVQELRPSYLARRLKLKVGEATKDILDLKKQQLEVLRLSRQLKKGIKDERIRNDDSRITRDVGSPVKRRSAQDCIQQPSSAGPQGN